jgi:hypothetical protein
VTHVVLPPRQPLGSGCWYVQCTCGLQTVGETADEARDAMAGCREAARKAGLARDSEARENRQRRRRMRREHRQSSVERGGRK